MKKKILFLFPWLGPLALLVLGAVLYSDMPTNFLGLILLCLAGLVSVYIGIHILWERQPMAAKILNTVLTFLVCMGLIVVAATGLVVARDARGQAEERTEYIVVLGAKVNGSEPSRILRQRIQAAYDYLTANPESVAVLSGGQGPDEGISEAQCMYNSLTDMGIDPQRLLLEDKSTSTWENLNFSLAILEQEFGVRPEKIGLVTSEFHLCRAGLFAKACHVEALGIPGRTDHPIHFVNYFLREIAGIWHYFILGG